LRNEEEYRRSLLSGDTNRHRLTQAQFATVRWNAIYTECVGTFSYLTLQDPS